MRSASTKGSKGTALQQPLMRGNIAHINPMTRASHATPITATDSRSASQRGQATKSTRAQISSCWTLVVDHGKANADPSADPSELEGLLMSSGIKGIATRSTRRSKATPRMP